MFSRSRYQARLEQAKFSYSSLLEHGEPDVLDDIDWARKPSSEDEVDDIDSKILKNHEFQIFVARLTVHHNKDFGDSFPTHPQYYLIKNSKGLFLIDNQGYDYPRYAVRLK